MRRKPAHRRDQAGLGTPHGLVVGLVSDDRRHEMLPLAPIGIRLGLLRRPGDVVLAHPLVLEDRTAGRRMAARRNGKRRLGALPPQAELAVAVFHHLAGVEELRPVVERVFDAVVVEVLVVDLAPELPGTDRHGLHRPCALHPTHLVDVVHAVVAENAARRPEKVVEPLDLPEQLVHPLRTGREIEIVGRIVLAVAVEGEQFPRLAVSQPLQEFGAAVAVTTHQPHAHLEILFGGLGGQFDDPLGRRSVDRHRLLHERVHALLDGVGKMRRAKRRRRGTQRDVAWTKAVDRLLVAVEPDEGPFLGHVDPLLELFPQRPLGDVHPVTKHVGHRHHLDRRPWHGERVDRRTSATPAAADQGHTDFIRARGVNVRNRPT